MSDRPIIFSAPMVNALLDGRKSMTRRILKPQPGVATINGDETILFCDGCYAVAGRAKPQPMPYAVGDRLWVRHSANVFPVHFKPIHFGEGKYAVGTDGNVYRRVGSDWVKCAPRLSHNGYEEISLRFGGEQRPFRVSRLVAEAFYGPAPDGWVCRHMDGTRRNNQPGNLDWGTAAQNSADAVAAGSFSGERASKARLSAEQVAEIRSSNLQQADLAAEYGVTQPTISKIRNGKRWGAVCDAPQRNLPEWSPWRSPIFCPRWASRLTLIVTDVRVQRLQEISEADAVAEGIEQARSGRFYDPTMSKSAAAHLGGMFYGPRPAFEALWTSIHGPEAWALNPWCAVLSFTVHRCNIDQMPGGDHE